MKIIKNLRFLGFVFFAPFLPVAEAGAVTLRELVDAEIARGKKMIVIPPGRYHQPAVDGAHLKFTGLKDVKVIAEGVELVCTLPVGIAVQIINCEGLEISGLTIDYDPLPFSQGEITAISEDGRVHEIRLFEGYPRAEAVINTKYEIFSPATRWLSAPTYYPESMEVVDSDHLRITKPARFAAARDTVPEKVGDWIVIAAGVVGGRHTVLARDSERLKFSDITMYASPMFGLLEVGCNDSVYERILITRRPAETDLRAREVPRLRSLNADGLHSKQSVRGPIYVNCRVEFNGDDGIAINGDYDVVMGAKGATLRVAAKSAERFAMKEGVEVQLVSAAGQSYPDARVLAVRRIGKPTAEEVAWLSKLNIQENLKPSRNHLNTVFEVVLDREVALEAGSLMASNQHLGNGFKITDSFLGYNRARGIIVKSGQGLITGNTITHTWLEGIKVAPEGNWLEAGGSRNLEITNNTIEHCRGPGIAAYAFFVPRQGPAPAGIHADLRIIGNRITACLKPSIFVTSTRGLTLRDNEISSPHSLGESHFASFYRLPTGERKLVHLINVVE